VLVTAQKAHKHLDGEVTLGYSSFYFQSQREEIFLPINLNGDIIKLVENIDIKNMNLNDNLDEIINCLAKKYHIDIDHICIDNTITYVSSKVL